MKGYLRNTYHRKALTLSFHGTPGTGKNFVAQLIGESIFKLGTKSQYYHFFSGRNYFSHEYSYYDRVNYDINI